MDRERLRRKIAKLFCNLSSARYLRRGSIAPQTLCLIQSAPCTIGERLGRKIVKLFDNLLGTGSRKNPVPTGACSRIAVVSNVHHGGLSASRIGACSRRILTIPRR